MEDMNNETIYNMVLSESQVSALLKVLTDAWNYAEVNGYADERNELDDIHFAIMLQQPKQDDMRNYQDSSRTNLVK
jgi:hypothetical protein